MRNLLRNPFALTLLSLLPWGFVGIGVVYAFFSSIQPEPVAPVAAVISGVDDGLPAISCPVVASEAFRSAAGATYRDTRWGVYTYDGGFKAPDVDITLLPGAGPNGETVCRMKITNAPSSPTGEIDWRMGNLAKVDGLRGKTVRYKTLVRANTPMRFDASYIYTHFGTPIEISKITNLSKDWLERTVTVEVPENATVAEFWYRLVIGTGIIVPGSGTIDFIPTLDIVD